MKVQALPQTQEMTTGAKRTAVTKSTALKFARAICAIWNDETLTNAEELEDDYFGAGSWVPVLDEDCFVSETDRRVMEVRIDHVATDGTVTDLACGLSFAEVDGRVVCFNAHTWSGEGKHPTWEAVAE